MKAQASSGKKARAGYDRMGMLGILLIAVIFLAVMASRSQSLSVKVSSFQNRQKELAALIDQEKERTEEIERLRDYMKTDAFAEQTARERLGLVKENEIVFQEVQ